MKAYNRAEAREEAARIRSDPGYDAPTNAELVAQYLNGMKYAARHLQHGDIER